MCTLGPREERAKASESQCNALSRPILSVSLSPAGLPSPESASAAMRTSGSSIDTTLVDRTALSSALIALAVPSGLAIVASPALRASVMFAYPGSILGRLLAEFGDPCAASGLPCVDGRLSNSGESTVLRSGKVISACVGALSGVCCGTAGHVVVAAVVLGERTSSDGGLSWESSIPAHALMRHAICREYNTLGRRGRSVRTYVAICPRQHQGHRNKREAETEAAEEERASGAFIGQTAITCQSVEEGLCFRGGISSAF